MNTTVSTLLFHKLGIAYRSGDTSLNSFLFSGLTCERKEAVKTNWPIVLEKLACKIEKQVEGHSQTTYPAKNALKGKLVTRTQYRNCETPESMMNTRNASINFRRSVVWSTYACHND